MLTPFVVKNMTCDKEMVVVRRWLMYGCHSARRCVHYEIYQCSQTMCACRWLVRFAAKISTQPVPPSAKFTAVMPANTKVRCTYGDVCADACAHVWVTDSSRPKVLRSKPCEVLFLDFVACLHALSFLAVCECVFDLFVCVLLPL